MDAFAAFAEPGLRLAAAAIAGMVIGLNRDIAGKAMGARTLGLVSVGAAIVALAAIGDPLIGPHPDARSRVVQGVLQGVLTGVGFLGAGVIVRRADNNDVKNLTTAATVWVTAAVGITGTGVTSVGQQGLSYVQMLPEHPAFKIAITILTCAFVGVMLYGLYLQFKNPEPGQVWRYELDGFEPLTLTIDP